MNFRTNEILFWGGSPGINCSKSQLDAPIYWRRRVISANTTGCGEGEALQKIHNDLLIRQDIAY
jgi:hypothetical protein